MTTTKGKGRRRANNEGSIYRRANGKWAGSISLGWDTDGKRKRRTVYGLTQDEVRRKLTDLKTREGQGLAINDAQTVAAYLASWLEDAVRPSTSLGTYTAYERAIRLHILPALARVKLTDLSTQQVQAMMRRCPTAATARDSRRVLAIALNHAIASRLVLHNAASSARPPKVPKLTIHPWSREQARAFLASVRGDRLEALWVLLLSVGLRRGEAVGLRWDDVDFEAGELHVCRTLQYTARALHANEPKTEGSRRTIRLPQTATAALRAHRTRQEWERRTMGPRRWHESGYIFTTARGDVLNPNMANHWFTQAQERADVPHIRLHDLRHTAATLALVSGVPVKVVSTMLGHTRIGITLDIYGHVLDGQRDEAASMIEAVFWGT